MRTLCKRSLNVLGVSLAIAAFPVAHGENANDMSVVMRDSFATADAQDIQWAPNKSVPAGMMTLMLYGDPRQPGPYIFRARMPAGYKLPPHRHPDERVVTVLEGTYWSGVGARFDPTTMNEFRPGAFYITRAGVPHYAWARTEVIIQEQGMGPVGNPIEYIDPADDPRPRN
jgi:quercetin dioxygenase-like cupin family protein